MPGRRAALIATLAASAAAVTGTVVTAFSATSATQPTTPAAPAVTVYVAGDSTASTYVTADRPRAGWGQALPLFLKPNATVVNVARAGASSKSFIDLGRLDHILGLIRSGDYLLVSFGHNDGKAEDPARYTIPATTYKSYLSQYVDKARARGAIPVLVTPVERRRFTRAGTAAPSHGAYAAAMRELAAAKRVPLVDLSASSLALWNRLGVAGTMKCFLFLTAGQSPNYPSGAADNTHFQAHGAIEIARLIGTALKNQAVLPAGDFKDLTTADLPDSGIVWPTTAPY